MFTDILTSEAVMEPVIAFLVGYWIRQYKKQEKYRVVSDLVVDIVDYIEEHYEEWGIRGSEKMNKFLELFSEEYKKQLGKTPTVSDIQTAKIRAEAQVQRGRREDKMAFQTKK